MLVDSKVAIAYIIIQWQPVLYYKGHFIGFFSKAMNLLTVTPACPLTAYSFRLCSLGSPHCLTFIRHCYPYYGDLPYCVFQRKPCYR